MNDHAADAAETSQYADGWRVRQRLVATFVGLFVGFLPLAGLLFAIFRSDTLVATLFVAFAAGVVIIGLWLLFWPCPRCASPFHLGRFGYFSLFRARCAHCGLARQVYTEHGQALVRGELDDPGE